MSDPIEDWLKSKGVTLWADWYIDDPKERKEAADWFLEQIESYAKFFREWMWGPDQDPQTQPVYPDPFSLSPRPQDHESQLTYTPPKPMKFRNDVGLVAGGSAEYIRATRWAEEQIKKQAFVTEDLYS